MARMRIVKIRKHERGILFRDREFERILRPGRHLFLDPLWRVRVDVVSVRAPWFDHAELEVIARSSQLEGEAQVLDLEQHQRALVWVNGRLAGLPISDGTSPSHGADRNGPTAVIKSLSKMDQIKSGGTLLNQRFLPAALKEDTDLDKLVQLIRTYFRLNGHHIQFNVVDTDTLRKAQQQPDEYRDLLVRVAGYSDYFVDLDDRHQEEIINRTTQETF